MFNKKVIFTILLFIIAIGTVSCVSAMDSDDTFISDNFDEDDWDDDFDEDEDDWDDDGITNDENDFYDDSDEDYESYEPINASLEVTQVGQFYKNKFLSVKLLGDEDDDFEGIEQIVKFSNGKSEYLYTDENGEATYKIPFNVGSYSATVSISDYHEGEFNCVPVTLKNIDISKTSAMIDPVKLSTCFNSGDFFQVKLVDANTKKALSGVKVTLKIYSGKKYKLVTIRTASNGIARYDVSKLTIGNHKVKVYVNDKNIIAKAQTSSINIKKAKIKISASKTKSKFKMAISNKKSGKMVKGVKVSVKVYTGNKYKTFTVKTNSKGVASISTKSLSKGNHKVMISTKGDKNYKSAGAKCLITK